MSDRSFIESWSLHFDDIAFVEGFNLVSRVWVAFQLRFFRTHGRFPSREDDPCPECLRYLGVRRVSERDHSALRAWLVEDCRRSCGAVEDQVAAGYAWCLARSIYKCNVLESGRGRPVRRNLVYTMRGLP